MAQDTVKKGSLKQKNTKTFTRKESTFGLNQSILGAKDIPRVLSNNYLLNKGGATMNSLPTNNYKKDTEG